LNRNPMKKQIQPDDLDMFREAVQGIEVLHIEAPAESGRKKPPPIPRPRDPEPLAPERAELSESEIETGDYLLFARPGVQHRVMADLQRGAYDIGLEVDLHGLHVRHAQALIGEFLAECRRRRVRCARIIHGKGQPAQGRPAVLKHKVNYWLRLHDEVLAFCSATRRDGGTGAVYVLLRNPRKRPRT